MTVTGRCRCGACRYEITGDALPPIYACHCHICQRATGSAFSMQALVTEDRLSVTGPVIARATTTGDGVSKQRYCGECYARIYNTNTRRPGIAFVRGGTLDRSEELACQAHIFTNYRQRWVVIPDGAAQWGEAAPTDAFTDAMRGGS